MRRTTRSLMTRFALGTVILAGGSLSVDAQAGPPPDGPRGGRPPEGRGAPWGMQAEAPMRRQRLAERPLGVTAIINLRRRLDLTPRQLTQLDSIERGLAAQRTALMQTLRAAAPARPAGAPAPGRPMPDSLRARLQAIRPQLDELRRADSTATAAAERILTEPQRATLREARAYARGRADAARGAGRRPRGGMRGGMHGGMRGGMGMGPRPGAGIRGRGGWGRGPAMGPMSGPAVRPTGARGAAPRQP